MNKKHNQTGVPNKTALWKFKAAIRESGTAFYLDEKIPFFGDYRQAKNHAKERQTRWERQNGESIDHVEPVLSLPPDKRQIPASLLRLAGYTMLDAVGLTCEDQRTSHNIITYEKDGRQKTKTIQSSNFKTAGKTVDDYLGDIRQKQLYDICVVAFNGVFIQENSITKAFIAHMYGAGLGDNCFVFQPYRPGSRAVPPAFTAPPKLNLGDTIIEQRGAWFDILTEGFCQHPEASREQDFLEQKCCTPGISESGKQ